MARQFLLFQSHLDLAHDYWKRIASVGDTVIDATCGNGLDTLSLSQIILNNQQGRVIACDLQEAAIKKTQELLQQHLSEVDYQQIEFIQACHSQFPSHLASKSVKLIVYNLGYLPGGDKAKTTRLETTLESLTNAIPLISPGGALTITCYPGHAEGKKEEDAILNWASTLDPKHWSCCHHRWLNRKQSPSLLVIQSSKV